jgi:translation initiation factor IF-2
MDKNEKHEIEFPPVVTVLGHVDHGKTTLLDAIRKSNIAEREHGGITQKIGASSIEVNHEGKTRKITFIDTPGHEAFSLMRGRGVMAADIGLLIVSVTDGVMPQTKESIAHLKASKIPFIVVLTKSDLPDRNIEKAKQQLLKEQISLEGYGGDVPVIEVSAKTNSNIKELLDLILLVFDLNKTQFNFSSQNPLSGIIIESKLDPKSGPRATVIVKNGTIHVRDEIYCEGIKCKVRSLLNDLGQQLKEATVGEAVEILGFQSVPKVGGVVHSTSSETLETKEEKRLKVEELEEGLPSFIIVADTLGSLEAIIEALPKEIQIALQKTGDIETSDVLFAKSTNSIILGFNVKVKPDVLKLSETEKVLVRTYNLIYEMLDEIEDLLEGKRISMQEQVYGRAKILAEFPFEKTKVLGLAVLEGRVAKGDRVRLVHGEDVIGESNVTSVRQGKDQISKVEQGKECGVIISPLLDFTIGDMLISHS